MQCAQASAACADLIQIADEHAATFLVQEGDLEDAVSGLTNLQVNPIGGRILGGTITIDPSNFDEASRIVNAPVTFNTVFGHELGHIGGNITLEGMGWLPGVTCDDSCALGAENAVRRDLGVSELRMRRPE